MAPLTGAQVIAQALKDVGVECMFGLVGIPVISVAEAAIELGMKFIAFRNEQAAGYAANAYGYLTGKPGVCLVVGGPGVLHVMAGVGNSFANNFPMLLLAGSSETHLVTKGAFQELDAISLLSPHVKLAVRPPGLDSVPSLIREAYRTAWYGRPGTAFVDLSADLIQGTTSDRVERLQPLQALPSTTPVPANLPRIVDVLRSAKAPLLVIGKGAAYSGAEKAIRNFVDATGLPFLPTPMGKGVMPDAHPLNVSSARSTALKECDVAILLGARLNWILHFGDSPKWADRVKFIQIDISPLEIGRNGADVSLGIVADIKTAVPQLHGALKGWRYDAKNSAYLQKLQASKAKNEEKAAKSAQLKTSPMKYAQVFETIKRTLHQLSSPDKGQIVYVSEGANTMDISRSIFNVEHPRLRLDAGTYASMGLGLGYAIAAHEAYNGANAAAQSGSSGRKKIVALEGDSAFGFSAMEVETMARYGMDILIFVLNNGGVYHGDSDSVDEWLKLQQNTLNSTRGGLRSTSLGYEVGYEKIAEMCGGEGYVVRTEDELVEATRKGFMSKKVTVVNIMIEAGKGTKLEFGWQASGKKKEKGNAKANL